MLYEGSLYCVLNHGRPAGEMQVVAACDSAVVRFQYVDRNRGPRVEARYRFGPSYALAGMEARGLGTDFFQTGLSERFSNDSGFVMWKSTADSGRAGARGLAFYRARSPTPYDNAILARFLLNQPSQVGALLPGGTALAQVVVDTALSLTGARQHLRLVAIDGVYIYPITLWLDDRDALFSSGSEWFITVSRGWEPVLPTLRRIEYSYHARRPATLATRLTPSTTAPIVIKNGDVFDSESGTLWRRTTVVVTGDRITAVGPAAAIAIPSGATVMDATGKTVLPGFWDMHTHLDFTAEEDGVLQLAAGITTARDLASDIDDALSRRQRAQTGEVLAPRAILAGFMEGPGNWAGPTSGSSHLLAGEWSSPFPFGDALGRRVPPDRAQGVQNHRHINPLLQQGASRRRQEPRRRRHHGRGAQSEPRQDALSGDPDGPPSDLDCLGNPLEVIDQKDHICCLGGDPAAMRGQCHPDRST